MTSEKQQREKVILCGLVLSKYGKQALDLLGFSNFSEAYNAFGTALKAKPASIKNYRDELDPYFPNERAGWHKRPLREHCKQVLGEYGAASLEELTEQIGSFLDPEFGLDHLSFDTSAEEEGESTFARRLITGKAAEAFFEANYRAHEEFSGGEIVNTTHFGCGFDFRINLPNRNFFAVEVKGLREQKGRINLTWKEYMRAHEMGDRYFLYVVSNFREVPNASIWRNPIRSQLAWAKQEQAVTITNWISSI